MSSVMAAPSTTRPAAVTAAPSALSSAGPREDGASKIRSTAMASGLPAAIFVNSWPCIARGNGHCSFSSAKLDSSMVTMTTDR